MATLQKIRVLIAHENSLIAAGLRAALGAHGDIDVVDVALGQDRPLPPRLPLHRADVVIADCCAGLQLVAEHGKQRRVLIVTDDETESSILRAVQCGVAGYHLLTSSLESLANGVRSAFRGEISMDPVVSRKMIASLTGEALSERELEVLKLMMLGLSNKAIARKLSRSVGTAKSHVKSIFAKLQCASRTEAVAIARRRGLVREESAPLPPAGALSHPGMVRGDFKQREQHVR